MRQLASVVWLHCLVRGERKFRDAKVRFSLVLQGILENLEPELDLWEAKG